MDAFFASVEQRDNPALRGKPIAVTGGGERTVVTTSSYEARAYGVKTAMTVYEAKRLCPSLILVTGNNRKYAQICTLLEEICLRFTPDIEIYSIDEVFLDITGSYHLFGSPEHLAKSIKDTVKNELGITCTVGMGQNILIAKLASDLAKPDGFRWIGEDAVASVLDALPVKKLWGIGPHTEEKLRAMGITTCGELGRAPLSLLVERFGIMGERLHAMGNGRVERPLEIVPPEPKSIGHSITLPKDLWKREEITSCLLRLSEKVGFKSRVVTHHQSARGLFCCDQVFGHSMGAAPHVFERIIVGNHAAPTVGSENNFCGHRYPHYATRNTKHVMRDLCSVVRITCHVIVC